MVLWVTIVFPQMITQLPYAAIYSNSQIYKSLCFSRSDRKILWPNLRSVYYFFPLLSPDKIYAKMRENGVAEHYSVIETKLKMLSFPSY